MSHERRRPAPHLHARRAPHPSRKQSKRLAEPHCPRVGLGHYPSGMVSGMAEITEAEREILRTLLREMGEERAAKRIGCGRRSLLRICAGLHVRLGTAALVRNGLASLDPPPEATP